MAALEPLAAHAQSWLALAEQAKDLRTKFTQVRNITASVLSKQKALGAEILKRHDGLQTLTVASKCIDPLWGGIIEGWKAFKKGVVEAEKKRVEWEPIVELLEPVDDDVDDRDCGVTEEV